MDTLSRCSLRHFSKLGVKPGTYGWAFGTGMDADSFTIDIISAARVPESGSTLVFIFLASIALFGTNRSRSLLLA